MSEKTYNLTLETMSPVHIGSGIKYRSSEFLKGRGNLNDEEVEIFKRINISNYISSLNSEDKEKFLKDLENSDSKLSNNDIKNKNKFIRYRSINKIESKKDEKNINQISECIKTLEKAYIPGSSIKGAIKTALLYNNLTFNDLDKIIEKKINNQNKANNLINSIFLFTDEKDNERNIFQYLRIEDTSGIQYPRVYEAWNLKPDSNNRKSKKNSGITESLETIDLNTNLRTKLTIENPRFYNTSKQNNDKLKYLDIKYIKKSIYNFSKELIEYELNFTDNNKNKKDTQDLHKFYENLKDINTVEKPLLRVGYGSSLMGTTIAMLIKQYDEFAKSENETFSKIYDIKYPTSRKVLYTKECKQMPLGWVQLIFK